MPETSLPIFRFAPSPNGALHLGHAYSALMNFEAARSMGGRFLLRIEDIDTARCTPALEEAMLHDLRWLGLSWEEPIRRQSEHFGAYAAALEKLSALGLTYRTTLSRSDIKRIVAAHESQGNRWPRDPDGAPHFPGRQHEASDVEGQNYAVRLDMKAALEKVDETLSWSEARKADFSEVDEIKADASQWGDVVLARRDTPTSYHLSVVVDDALQSVSHIVRGADLKEATAVHRLLQKLLGLPAPLYHHHGLILGSDGRKLSKSEGAKSIASLRASGPTPEDIRRDVGL